MATEPLSAQLERLADCLDEMLDIYADYLGNGISGKGPPRRNVDGFIMAVEDWLPEARAALKAKESGNG